MKNRRIEVKMGRTINTGDYESYRIDVGLAHDIGNDEILNEAFHKLFIEVGKQLMVNANGVNKKDDPSRGKPPRSKSADESRFRRGG